jgi:hypothetical protein
MCCPVYVRVTLTSGTIDDPGEVLQNSFDLVPNGQVLGPDFSYFATAYVGWTQNGIPDPTADFVWSEGQTVWGEVTGPDFSAFASHYGHQCTPWNDPCGC